MCVPRIAVLLSIASLLSFACYNPNIAEGGFTCGTNSACPDNFHCNAINNRCYRGDAGLDVSCSSPPPTPLCSTEPASGQACNPTCQTGCNCGWCTIGSGGASCTMAAKGTGNLGDTCNPNSTAGAQCKPGFYCQAECNNVGRCYRVCNADGDCNAAGAGTSACSLKADTNGFTLCTPVCNPLDGSGCASGSACYAQFPGTFCGCEGTKGVGASCTNVEECRPGYSCIGPANSATCTQVCATSSTCASDGGALTCQLVGSFGYCSM